MSRTTGAAGFTYLGLLTAMTIISIMVAVIGPSWRAVSKAEKERELLWRGHQFRQAITLYVNERIRKGQPPSYPSSFEDLLKDPGSPGVKRYLRQIYADPMSSDPLNPDDWVKVLGPGGGIIGVHSASDDEPLKKDFFDLEDQSFTGKTKYSEWIFKYP